MHGGKFGQRGLHLQCGYPYQKAENEETQGYNSYEKLDADATAERQKRGGRHCVTTFCSLADYNASRRSYDDASFAFLSIGHIVKRYLRDKLPKPTSITENKYLRFLSPWLGHPRLWHMHRRSVARGVSIGLVAGLVPGPVQMLLAVIIAIPLRANILAAAATTWYTNPLTFIPLYILAYTIGALVTGEPVRNVIPPDFSVPWLEFWKVIPAMFDWFVSLGSTLLIGLAIQSAVFAVGGYVATMVLWRCIVSRMWSRRKTKKQI